MSGAYVAKPAVVSVPSVPPGWDEDWPFPGPLPPGYGMDLSLNLTAVATYTPGATHNATVSLRDQVDYGTTEPDGPNKITWTATLDGVDMQLKLDGGVYASYIESDYADIGDYWGAEPTFVFPVTIFDGGKVITLKASSINPFIGYVVEDASVAITVYDPVFTLSMSADSPIDWDGTSAVEVVLEDHGSTWTIEPVGYEITFTATVDGRECMDPLTVDYSAVGASWGHADNFTFDLTEDDAGKTITLNVESTAWGDEVSDSVNIVINPLISVVSIEASVVADSWVATGKAAPLITLRVTRSSGGEDRTQMSEVVTSAPWTIVWDYNPTFKDQLSENECTAGSLTLTSSASSLNAGDTYNVLLYANPGPESWDYVSGNVTFTVTITLSDESVVTDSVVLSVVEEGPSVGAHVEIEVDNSTITWVGF